MTIYLTEPKHLEAGLWWARLEEDNRRDGKHGDWVIVQVTGVFPFLKARAAFYCRPNSEWIVPTDELGIIDNPNKWEFGPRVNVPSDKERAEYPPQPMERSR